MSSQISCSENWIPSAGMLREGRVPQVMMLGSCRSSLRDGLRPLSWELVYHMNGQICLSASPIKSNQAEPCLAREIRHIQVAENLFLLSCALWPFCILTLNNISRETLSDTGTLILNVTPSRTVNEINACLF
jgi:hypothetical protein